MFKFDLIATNINYARNRQYYYRLKFKALSQILNSWSFIFHVYCKSANIKYQSMCMSVPIRSHFSSFLKRIWLVAWVTAYGNVAERSKASANLSCLVFMYQYLSSWEFFGIPQNWNSQHCHQVVVGNVLNWGTWYWREPMGQRHTEYAHSHIFCVTLLAANQTETFALLLLLIWKQTALYHQNVTF